MSPTPTLTSFSVLTFDVYGTLMDWETGLYTAAAPLLSQASPTFSTPLSRTEFLTIFATLEHSQQAATPGLKYSSLLSSVYLEIASALSLPEPSKEEADAFAASVKDWPAFPDTLEALKTLKKYYKLVVLSNIDAASFEMSLPKLGGEGTFDAVLTAEAIGSYKPDLNNFEYMLKEVKERFGVEKSAILHTAQSLFHDHIPAEQLEIRSAWISRREAAIGIDDDTEDGEEEEKKIGAWEWRWDTLGEMADAVVKDFEST